MPRLPLWSKVTSIMRSTTSETRELEHELRKLVSGEVRFDAFSKVLYSTDASIYQMEPVGVVIPRNKDDVLAVVDVARRSGVPILPRGGGTSLAGQTVNHAIVMDFSKYMDGVLEVNPEEKWARVQPGVVLDDLNRRLATHGLKYARTHLPPTGPPWAAASATTPAAPTQSYSARPATTSLRL